MDQRVRSQETRARQRRGPVARTPRACEQGEARNHAAPISATKWGLYGPVWARPGTLSYQRAPSISMNRPLRAPPAPSTAATMRFSMRLAIAARYDPATEEQERAGATQHQYRV